LTPRTRGAHDPFMRRRALAVAVVFAAISTFPARAQTPKLVDMLARASSYVREFEQQLSNIVAEETYEQAYRSAGGPGGLDRPRIQRRTLKSDLLLMRPVGDFRWVQFRDVFEVDGTPVRDRTERLTALFSKPSRSALDRIARIRRESARYNIGAVDRTMNVPLVPLQVLDDATRSRFKFTWEGDAPANPRASALDGAALPDSPRFRVSTEVWIVGYEEVRGPTIVRSPGGRNLFSRGRLWIEASSGRVLMGEIIIANRDVTATLAVSFQSEPLLGLLVPVEMREQYRIRTVPDAVTGTATYGRFRRFEVASNPKGAPIR
jgi:hypothetical protein